MNSITITAQQRLKKTRPHRVFIGLLVLLAALALSACGGGADTQTNPQTGTGGGSAGPTYTGPAPATNDVQSFKINVWDKLAADNRCGQCHGVSQPPMFVNLTDINAAYTQALGLVDLAAPANSAMVAKVAGGHNCWLDNNSVCGQFVTDYITAWASGSGQNGGRTISLTPPPEIMPGSGKVFPADTTAFQPVHNLLTTYCSGCHIEASVTAQQPYFAESDIAVAYEAAKPKIDLNDPANSRFVLRLREEFHNCWSDCATNAQEMENAIAGLASVAQTDTPDPSLVLSRALKLTDGVVASGGNRYEANIVGQWDFKSGVGTTAYDTSGVDPAIDLTFSGDVQWVGGWGIQINNGKAQGSTSASKKLHDTIKLTGEYSIEAWVVPANVTQENSRIVSYSQGTDARNFTLGQTLYNYDFMNRSSVTDINGEPTTSTPNADENLQAALQHVVATFDPVNGRRIYVNGVLTNAVDTQGGGALTSWDDTYALVFGNEVSGDRLWRGTLRMVAIHNRAMSAAQVQQNFDAGVGEKFFLLFNVSHLVNVPQAYIMMEVSQYDSYSYLFHTPTFISLDANAQPDNIPVQGMRIGINGKEASVGQAYGKMDTMISAAQYTANGQQLSRLGTVIPLERGPISDEFFLTFERLGDQTHVYVEPQVPTPATPADLPPVSDIGVRTFDEINASMSDITGVEPFDSSNANFNASVKTTFTTIRQQLPAIANMDGFLSAHQMAVTQLAITYCDALVANTSLRSSAQWWPTFSFADPANTVLDEISEQDAIITPLLINVANSALVTQPTDTQMRTELRALMSNLVSCAGTCPAGRTADVVKAACAAAVGSGVMLIQ